MLNYHFLTARLVNLHKKIYWYDTVAILPGPAECESRLNSFHVGGHYCHAGEQISSSLHSPVSYTHLDVYKRQAQTDVELLDKRWLREEFLLATRSELTEIKFKSNPQL